MTSLHWKVLLTVSGPVPRWATAGSRDQYTNPSAKDFQLFMQAVGRHYGKTVKLYSIWNEPNQPQYLRPQYVSGRLASPALYRSLFLAGYAGLKASGNFAGMKVLMGETSPIGVLAAGIPAPLAFMRGVLCLDGSYHPIGHCSKLPADGYAQHPYTSNLGPFWVPGGKQDPHHDDITIATLGRLSSALDRAAAAGAIRPDLPIYVTEFGIQSYPNHTLGVPLAQQAEFQAISEKIAWSNPRVVSFDQYLLRDDPPTNGFQSGLETYKGAVKPVYGGFRLPLVVTRTHTGVSFWGLVRPGDGPGREERVRWRGNRGGVRPDKSQWEHRSDRADGLDGRRPAARRGDDRADDDRAAVLERRRPHVAAPALGARQLAGLVERERPLGGAPDVARALGLRAGHRVRRRADPRVHDVGQARVLILARFRPGVGRTLERCPSFPRSRSPRGAWTARCAAP